jgi:hypothetical protein
MNYTDATTSQKAEFRAQREIYRATTSLEFIHAHADLINELGVIPSVVGQYVDFDGLTRPQIMLVHRHFHGKWTKTTGYDGGIIYTLEQPVATGLQLRLYNGEPPASCEIVETIEYVEVPARTERRVTRTVKCPEPASATN